MDVNYPYNKEPKMEIRDVIHGSIEVLPWELAVVEDPFFQRLRHIHQLGFAELAYPCATHTRFTHSIGTMCVAGKAFQEIFRNHEFSSTDVFWRFYFLVRVSALLHDVGHGPLSHTTEFAMPEAKALGLGEKTNRRATHEDYTLKIVLDSSLSDVLKRSHKRFGIEPHHIAATISMEQKEQDNFFIDNNVNFRKLLHQIISSEIDADRMDYLKRDSYYTGASYGHYDSNWLLSNLSFHTTFEKESDSTRGIAHLALSSKAIYTFEDFLLSRYHMFLMVYYHYKSVITEKLLKRYFNSPDSTYIIPTDIEKYIVYNDYHLYHHLNQRLDNPWAKRVAERKPYHLSLEIHSTTYDEGPLEENPDVLGLRKKLKDRGVDYIETLSRGPLSKYAGLSAEKRKDSEIYVRVGNRTNKVEFVPLANFTELFRRYEQTKQILRIYTPEKMLDL